jgi:TRAP-type uncharacterized transport system substrate-binding protein
MPPGGGNKKTHVLLVLAVGLLIFATAAGAVYLASRPITLRIAVGPTGSDDQRLIEALADTLASERSSVRLALIATAGSVDNVALLGSKKADLAVARADSSAIPRDVRSVAILRKNVVVLWSSPRPKDNKKQPASKIKEIDDLKGRSVGSMRRR